MIEPKSSVEPGGPPDPISPVSTDPVYQHAKRESGWILAIWFGFAAWVIGYSRMRGYDVDPEQLTLTLGMPSWVFWGIAAPWFLANVVTILFSFCYMTDHVTDENDNISGQTTDSAPI